MAYTKTTWNTGDPITQERMNHIEQGIEDAHGLSTSISTAQSTASGAATLANTNAGKISQLETDVANLQTSVEQGVGYGTEAMTQIHAATDSNEVPYDNLDARFTAIENKQIEEQALRQANSDQINSAMRTGVSQDTLGKRFAKVESDITTLSNGYNGLHQDLVNAGGYDDTTGETQTLMTRLNNIDGSTTPTRTLPSVIQEITDAHGTNNVHGTLNNRFTTIETELENAHESTALGKTGNNKYSSIDARFEAIEEELTGTNAINSRLDTLAGNIEDLTTHKISDTAIANNLTTDTAGKVLDARQGKALDEAKINILDIRDDLTHNESDKPLSAKQGKVLKDALDALDTAVDTRLDALEAEVDMASNDGERRLDDIEARLSALDGEDTGAIDAIHEQIATIAGELGMTDTNGLKTIGTRVDELDTHIQTVAEELGMVQSGEIVNTNTRVDTLETTVGGITSDLDTATTGLKARMTAAEGDINTLEADLNTTTTGIKDRLTAAEGDIDTLEADLNTANTGLKARVSALENEPKSATTIYAADCITYDAETGDPTIYEDNTKTTAITPTQDVDYLLAKSDGKYYYWKYIGTAPNGTWNLISGAGGGGTGSSSGMFAASLSATDIPNPDENTDYFVGNNTIGYTHYRYVVDNNVGSFVKILPKGLLAGASVNANGKPVITTLEDANTNVLNSFNALKSVNCTTTYDTDGVTPKSYALSFTDINGQEYEWDLAAGGGGSSYTVQFINAGDSLELYVPNDATSAVVSARIYARLGQELLSQTGSITVKYKTESASDYTTARVIADVANNTVTNIDVIDLLAQNSTTNIQLTASIQPEDTPITRNITYTIHRVPMSIEAYNYNPASVKTSNFNFQYYCIGSNLAKIVHFVIDGVDTTEDVGTPANTDLLTKQISVSSLARGMHSLKVYFKVGNFSSNEINTYFLYDDGTNANMPMIALSTNKSTIQDGENLNLYYTVYTKGQEKTEEVTLETYTIIDNVRANYETKSYTNIDNSIEHTIAITNYPSSGTFYMAMTAKHTVGGTEYTDSKTTSVAITEYESAYDTQMTRAGTANLIYDYDAAGRTNNDSDKEVYEHEYTSASGDTETFSGTNTGFNWASNGYVDGSSLIISGGAVHSIDVPLFLAATNSISLETDANNDDILKNGRTFEIDYEVNSATQLNAEIASFGSGLKITPSVSYLVPQGTTVTVNSHGLIEKEDEICAAYLATGKRMHMVFVIEPKATTPTSQGEYHQCVNIYINGEFVNSCPYALSDNFSTNSTFTIGSNTCIIKLYSVRMYNRGLTNDEVLRNYMMAPVTKIDKINRFAANDVLDNNKLVSYEKARNKFNCLLITGEISPYKKSTKTPSGVTLTKPDFENLTYTTEFNLLDKNESGNYYSSNNVQGTSSQTYPIHNLKVYLAREEVTTSTNAETGEEETVRSSKKVKYSLKGASGIAESTLCWKADYMSTDHANTLNANFANNLFTNKLPSQVADSKVQNTVYGIRCLLFQRDDEQSAPVFIADGCLNNDKGNNSAFGLSVSGDSGNNTTRQKWEFTNNSSALDFFRADGLLAQSNGDFYAKTAFESTYPDEGDLDKAGLEPNYNHLQVLMTWVHQRANYWDASTTEGTGGTYNGTSYSTERELKKAIFINEFQDHFNLNHALTYHLFSEFIALCDNRAKNMFLRCDNVLTEEVLDTANPANVIFSGNSNPNASFFESTTNIGTNDDPIYAFTHADQIDWENSTFAIWYPVLYDLDSCYGVENVGRITIPYDAEWDYSYNGKNQFSGVESRLWLMVEDAFGDELKALAQTLYPNSLNYNTFYNTQIATMNESTCPAIINQDMLLKFNAYWADGFIDYSLPNNPHVYRDYKYIQRGSRAYQKDTFIKLRANYLSSKYVTSNFMNDQIRFRSSVIIPVSNSGITVTTNQTLYPAITYGDNKEAIRSATKIGPGGSVTLYASDQVGNTDTIHIGGASALTDIGDISKFEPYNLDVSGGVNLKSLVVGSNVVNASTNKIDGLGSCALLETLNVRNCTNFSGTLNLSGNGLIKNVYASGSGITNIELREGGNLTNIEYSAATTAIKIINHGSLQSFVYEGASTNHYANVTKLHIENTPNVPVVDIINHAMSHLTAGLRLAGIDVDLFADTSTQEEIDAALETTTQFLNTLVSDFAYHKYINSAGVFVSNSSEPPYITGKVHITSIRQSLLTKLNSMYPNLIIYNTIDSNGTVANNIITEYTVEYRNYDGTLLYTDYRTGREHFIDPTSLDQRDIDPITQDRRIPIPTKPDDAQYKYTFGSYDSGDYIRYSGWVRQYTTTNPVDDDYPQGNTVFIAYYPTTQIQRYTVNWYEEPTGIAIKTYTDIYGTDISEYTQPEEDNSINQVKVDGNTIKVFKGWDKPVGKLTGNVNVYAQWETSTIDNSVQLSDIVMENLSAADLAAIARLGADAKRRILEDKLGNSPILVQMGHDFNYTSGVNTVDLLNGSSKYTFTGQTTEAKIFDGAHGTLPEVRPLATNGDWTLAIDYKFLLTQALFTGASEWTLASCYSDADSTIQGFKLSLVKNGVSNSIEQYVRLTWGNTSVNIDYVTIDRSAANAKQYSKSYRNMLVLRHKSAEPTNLYVYFVAPNTSVTDALHGSNIGATITQTILTWDNGNLLNVPLILGGNYIDPTAATLQIENAARGIIYWAKFWDKDLGNKNCEALATWTHEKIPFFLSGYENNESPTRQIIAGTNLMFIAAQSVSDRKIYFARGALAPTDDGYYGWRDTLERNICNNRFFKGMATQFQSIVLSTNVKTLYDSLTNPGTYDSKTVIDQVYLPAEVEVSSETPNNEYKLLEVSSIWSNENEAWPWMKINNINNWYVNNSGNVLTLATAENISPFLLRFIGNYIKPTAKIFYITRDPYNNGGTWTYNNAQISVQSGDIWILPQQYSQGNYNYSANVAFIYYTNAEINEGVYVDMVNDGGGWKKAEIWPLRTYNIIPSSGAAYNTLLEKVEDNGNVMITPGNTYRRTEGHILCPEFSI